MGPLWPGRSSTREPLLSPIPPSCKTPPRIWARPSTASGELSPSQTPRYFTTKATPIRGSILSRIPMEKAISKSTTPSSRGNSPALVVNRSDQRPSWSKGDKALVLEMSSHPNRALRAQASTPKSSKDHNPPSPGRSSSPQMVVLRLPLAFWQDSQAGWGRPNLNRANHLN